MMSSENNHIGREEHFSEETEKLFRSIKPPFSKTKDELWLELNSKLSANKRIEPVVREFSWLKYAAAASVLLLFGLGGLFAKLHKVEAVAMNGEHVSQQLPDGSEVILNAGSELSYHPYWWWANRDVSFEGEGFFNVVPGSEFTVASHNGTTTVLGTSFNINSRNDEYSVYCATGKVRVENKAGQVVLSPQELAVASVNAVLSKTAVRDDGDEIVGWMNYNFSFMASPMRLVFKELELQYDIQIELVSESIGELKYSGHFDKITKVESVLHIIEQSMGLKFVKKGEHSYSVSQVD
jgi:ferric-dicitrate binding protein FerR (iron transport regulator)